MNKKLLLAILTIGLTVAIAPDRASATNAAVAGAVLDPNAPNLTAGTSSAAASAIAPSTTNNSFWQGIQGASGGSISQQVSKVFQAGANGGFQGGIAGGFQAAIAAGTAFFQSGGRSGIDLNSILNGAQQGATAAAQNGANKAIAEMQKSNNPNVVADASDAFDREPPSSSVAEAILTADGVEVASQAVLDRNPALGTPLDEAKIEAKSGAYIANSATSPAAIAKTTADIGVNTASAAATKDAVAAVVGTNDADSSLEELQNIKKVQEVIAANTSQGVIGTANLTKEVADSKLLQGSMLSLASSEAQRQILKQQEEESQLKVMQRKAIYGKALLANIGSGGATNIDSGGTTLTQP